jgi:hypothetical protein
MSDEIESGYVKCKITADFILELYDEMKEEPDPLFKRAKLEAIEELSNHLGEWLVLPDD